MKSVFSLGLGLLVALAGSAALAEDHRVSSDALSAVGLGNMKVVSDQGGMQVRGMSSFARATSLSAVSGILYDPDTGSSMHVNASDFAQSKDYGGGWYSSSSARAKARSGVYGEVELEVGKFEAETEFRIKGFGSAKAGRSYGWGK